MSTHKTWNRSFLISFNNPLLTLPGIQIDLYPTFYFLVFRPTSCVHMCLYVTHADLIELFCRKKSGQLVVLRCMLRVGFGLIFTIHAKNLDSGYSSFQTAKLVNP